MNRKLANLFSETPAKPDYNPIRNAMDDCSDRPDAAAALKLFLSMPSSTGVLANPVCYHLQIPAADSILDLDIRSFTVRGTLFEEDIIDGSADTVRVIFVGLFGRAPVPNERKLLEGCIAAAFEAGVDRPLKWVAEFMKEFPKTSPDIAMQHWSTIRKARYTTGPVQASRPPADLLKEMIGCHMENVAVAAASSYMRSLEAGDRIRGIRRFMRAGGEPDPFRTVFNLLLRRTVNDEEARILERLGSIQVHHGSAGSNMIARYFASLHTRSVSDLFTASQMALDCGRHFGAITAMTDFVHALEKAPKSKRDDLIRERILEGNLPTFGHPEISAAGRENHLEMDPRPALYLAPLFEAMDSGAVTVNSKARKRVELMRRIYQIALVEGVEKTSGLPRLRLTPNTDFGSWIVQEVLGIEEPDRTLLSYAYRGFGWMMDVREQLQQPIIRPVIPPDPAIFQSASPRNGIIPEVISRVHHRLMATDAF